MGGISYSQRFVLFVMLHAVIPSKIMTASNLVPTGLSSVLHDEKPFELALSFMADLCISRVRCSQPFLVRNQSTIVVHVLCPATLLRCQWVWSVNSSFRHFLLALFIPKLAVCFSFLNMNSLHPKSHHRH